MRRKTKCGQDEIAYIGVKYNEQHEPSSISDTSVATMRTLQIDQTNTLFHCASVPFSLSSYEVTIQPHPTDDVLDTGDAASPSAAASSPHPYHTLQEHSCPSLQCSYATTPQQEYTPSAEGTPPKSSQCSRHSFPSSQCFHTQAQHSSLPVRPS